MKIKCPNCNNEIEDYLAKCYFCDEMISVPLELNENSINPNIKKDPIIQSLKSMGIAYGVAFIGLLIFSIVNLLHGYNSSQPDADSFFLYSLVICGSAGTALILVSIFEIAKALNKNALTWLIVSIAFPFIIVPGSLYLSIIAVYRVIATKFSLKR